MRRTHQALATLALALALTTTATTTAAAAAPPTGTPDQAAARKALYHSELDRNLQLRTQADTEAATAHGLAAARKALYQSELDRNLATTPAADHAAIRPSAQTNPAAPSPAVDVLTTLLVGLIGGLVGGAAATVGWTATTHRRHPPAAAGT
jgi:hypothetical protein